VLSVSSKVMFPELPDASMDTRKPIAFPQYSPDNYSAKQIFRIIAERPPRVNAERRLVSLGGNYGSTSTHFAF